MRITGICGKILSCFCIKIRVRFVGNVTLPLVMVISPSELVVAKAGTLRLKAKTKAKSNAEAFLVKLMFPPF